MIIFFNLEDDFEDIWPKSERISTYIKNLVNWRPPCLFGDLPESEDDEDEEIEERERIEELNRKLESSVAKYSLDKTGIWTWFDIWEANSTKLGQNYKFVCFPHPIDPQALV